MLRRYGLLKLKLEGRMELAAMKMKMFLRKVNDSNKVNGETALHIVLMSHSH